MSLFLSDGPLSQSLSRTRLSTPHSQLVGFPNFTFQELADMTGRGVCAGKQLGLMEMRYVLMDILSRYDIAFAPGTNPQAFIDGLRDCYTLELPRLDMVFTPRASANGRA
jgi:cytochrome P450